MSSSTSGALVRPLGRTATPKMHHHAHPHVRQLFTEAARLGLSMNRLEKLSGLSDRTVRAWARGGTPNVRNLEAALAVVGLELTTTRRGARS